MHACDRPETRATAGAAVPLGLRLRCAGRGYGSPELRAPLLVERTPSRCRPR